MARNPLNITLILVLLLSISGKIIAQVDSLHRQETDQKSLYHLRELQYQQQMEAIDPLKRNIGHILNYIDAGGFVILGEPNPKLQTASFGKGISIRPIPLTHPIYDCFFTPDELGFHGSWGETGIWKGNELVGICSNTFPGQWSETYSMIPETQMKRSVNIIVYGLMRNLE